MRTHVPGDGDKTRGITRLCYSPEQAAFKSAYMPTIKPIDKNKDTEAARVYSSFEDRFDRLPNFFGTLANSPAALRAYVAFTAELEDGDLGLVLSEKIALAVAGENSSEYCAAVHTRLAKESGIPHEETALNVSGISSDQKTGLILQFVVNLIRQGGKLSKSDVNLLRDQNVTNSEIVEIVARVGIAMFSNMLNNVAETEHDATAVVVKDYS